MTWRGSTEPKDRFFACLPYLIPLIDGLVMFGLPLLINFPFLQPLFLPLAPLIQLYRGIPFASLAIFFALFLLVVRNEQINHFIRFNAMQAIMLDIVLILCNVVSSLVLVPILGSGSFITQTLFNAVFLGTLAAVVYAVVQNSLGRYPEIPTISDAVHSQIR